MTTYGMSQRFLQYFGPKKAAGSSCCKPSTRSSSPQSHPQNYHRHLHQEYIITIIHNPHPPSSLLLLIVLPIILILNILNPQSSSFSISTALPNTSPRLAFESPVFFQGLRITLSNQALGDNGAHNTAPWWKTWGAALW